MAAPPAPNVRIQQPSEEHDKDRPMPSSFVAVGTAAGKAIKKVTVTLQATGEADPIPEEKIKLLRFDPVVRDGKPVPHEYQWAFAFLLVTDDTAKEFTLTAVGRNADGDPVPGAKDPVVFFVDKARDEGNPRISYPPSPYVIEPFEQVVFMPFGSSDIPMTRISIGGRGADFIGYDSNLEFWYAVFSNLDADPGTGDRLFVASNADADEFAEVKIV